MVMGARQIWTKNEVNKRLRRVFSKQFPYKAKQIKRNLVKKACAACHKSLNWIKRLQMDKNEKRCTAKDYF